MLGAVGHKSFSDKNPEITAKVHCVAAGGAPCDFTDMPLDNTFLKYWLGSTRGDKPDIYHAASPLQLVSVASAPIMFYNGTFDLMVRPNSAKSLSVALAKFGIDTAQHWYQVQVTFRQRSTRKLYWQPGLFWTSI